MSKLKEVLEEFYKAKELFEEKEAEADETIEKILEEEIGVKFEIRTFIEDCAIYFEVLNMLDQEITKYEDKIEKTTNSKRRNVYSFYFE